MPFGGIIDPRLAVGGASAAVQPSISRSATSAVPLRSTHWAGRGILRALAWAWTRNPFAIAVFVFAFDFGILLAIRNWERGSLFVPWDNRTFAIGDSIFLPAYAGFAAMSLRSDPPVSALFRSKRWHLAVIAAGIALAVGLDLIAVGAGHTSVFAQFRPSKAYHTAIVPVLFYLLVSVLPLHLTRRSKAGTLALLALSCYLAISLVEIHYMARTSVEVAVARISGPFPV